MGCDSIKCPPFFFGAPSRFEREGHTSWPIDFDAITGMKRYGVWYLVPCLRLHWTWFGAEKALREAMFRGEIRTDLYGHRTATLYQVRVNLPDEEVWASAYDATENGAEPYEAIYTAHAILAGNAEAEIGKGKD